jgi:hypothetical protein
VGHASVVEYHELESGRLDVSTKHHCMSIAVSSRLLIGRILYPPTILCTKKSCKGFLNGCEKVLAKGECAILHAVSTARDMEGRTIMRWFSVLDHARARKLRRTITYVNVPTEER